MDPSLLQKAVKKSGLKLKPEAQEEAQPELPKETTIGQRAKHVLLGGVIVFGSLFFGKRLLANSKDEILTLEANMDLTKDIKLGQYLVSSEAPELKTYELSPVEYDNVRRHSSLLQKINDAFSVKVFINSGGRPNTLKIQSGKYKGLTLVQMLTEKGYKPAKFSQHMDFSAADFTVDNKKLLVPIYNFLRKQEGVTQVILYVENGEPDFIHLGIHSSAFDFEHEISDVNRHLIAKVTVEIVDNKKNRTTNYMSYSQENMNKVVYNA